MVTRAAQRASTRALLVETGVRLLVERGYAGLTTVAVQKAAGLSRGALLHHFPTRDDLVAAVIRRLLEMHEAAAGEALRQAGSDGDRVARAIEAMFAVMRRPAFAAQVELWTAARTDPGLRSLVAREEQRAGRALARVVDGLFGPELAAHPRFRQVTRLTLQVLRGLALTDVLREDDEAARRTLDDWIAIASQLLEPQEVIP